MHDPLEKQIRSKEIIGSSRIADLCALYLAHHETQDWEELYALCKKLVGFNPDMAAVATLVDSLLFSFYEGGDLKALIDQALETSKRMKEQICRYGIELIADGDFILTHSYSSTVKEVLMKAHRLGKSFEVGVTLSKPGEEGKQLVQDLTRVGISAQVVDINSLYQLDKVFFGADRISEHHFVNKVGTRAIAMSAAQVFIFSGTNKFLSEKYGVSVKMHPFPVHYRNFIVENPLLEVIPLKYATGIVCEEGLLIPERAKSLLKTFHFPELFDSQ